MKHLCLIFFSLALAASAAATPAPLDEFQQLRLARHYAAMEALARERLARDPLDEAALWHWAQQAADDRQVRADLLPRAQACVQARPQSARCQHVLGVLIGAELMDSGGLSAMRRVGEVREQFERAVALAPADYAMRKAREQAEALARLDAPRGVLMQAVLALYDKAFDTAEQRLASVQPGADRLLASDLQGVQVELGLAMLDAGAAARALAWFERLQQHDANSPEVQVGLGRTLLALKQPAAAAKAFERAVQLNPRLRDRVKALQK